jgi:hypothetical protein
MLHHKSVAESELREPTPQKWRERKANTHNTRPFINPQSQLNALSEASRQPNHFNLLLVRIGFQTASARREVL